MSRFLTIAIPTFNRQEELQRCISLIFDEIKGAELEGLVGLYVADNCSPDDTAKVLEELQKVANARGIVFEYIVQESNFGPDKNTIDVYLNAESEYVWWFSDDDLIEKGALQKLVEDLQRNQPTVCISCFRQPPFNEAHLPFERKEYGSHAHSDLGIQVLLKRAKITSYVVKKGTYNRMVPLNDTFWGFLGLSLMRYLEEPSLLVRESFIARCDENYLNIRFNPNVNVKMYYMVLRILNEYGCGEKINLINKPDPVAQSIHFMELYYRRRAKLDSNVVQSIKNEIYSGIIMDGGWKKIRYQKQLARALLARIMYQFKIKY